MQEISVTFQNYNNALAMTRTSLGCDQDRAINRDGNGPYVLKVQGCLYHQIGSLLPQPGVSPIYAQLYIYDPQKAVNFRMNNQANSTLDRATMQTLQNMLFCHHPAVQLYKQAFELTQHMGPDQPLVPTTFMIKSRQLPALLCPRYPGIYEKIFFIPA
jgi:hypothetical protein